MTRNLKMALGGFALLIIVVGMVFSGKDTPKNIIQQQLTEIQKGKYDKAYSYFTKDFQSTTPLKDYQTYLSKTKALKNNKNVSFKNETTKDNKSVVNATLKDKENLETPVEYTLVKENNDWKIQSINLNP